MSTPLPATQEQLSRLEDAVEQFVTNVGIEFNKLYNSQMRTETELRAFKDETRVDRRKMNRKWGYLANKLGTMVEDLIYPSLSRIVRQHLRRDVTDLIIRHKRKLRDGRVKEFDAIAVTDDGICLNSTKATLRSADVDQFVADIATFREFFPEYCERPVIGLLATLAVDESVLSYAEKTGFFVLAVGDEIMEVQNHAGFDPKRW